MTADIGPTRGVTAIERDDLRPLCPHCDERLSTMNATAVRSSGSGAFGFGKRYAYACPKCNRLLGVSHRKGFWMG